MYTKKRINFILWHIHYMHQKLFLASVHTTPFYTTNPMQVKMTDGVCWIDQVIYNKKRCLWWKHNQSIYDYYDYYFIIMKHDHDAHLNNMGDLKRLIKLLMKPRVCSSKEYITCETSSITKLCRLYTNITTFSHIEDINEIVHILYFCVGDKLIVLGYSSKWEKGKVLYPVYWILHLYDL